MSEGEMITCPSCAKDVKILRVKKEGSNNGKLFISCNPKWGGCGAFAFRDADGSFRANKRSRTAGMQVHAEPDKLNEVLTLQRDTLVQISSLQRDLMELGKLLLK